MKQENLLKGIIFLLLTTISWGGMFPVAKAALTALDGFYLSAYRYGIASIIFLFLLYFMEGSRAFSFDGKFWRIYFFGTMGFAGFSILAFVGLSKSTAEHGAIIMALMPLITAILNWAIKGARPSNITLGCIAAALFGVFLVITKGHPETLLYGGSAVGDLLILLGAASWVVYTIGAGYTGGWSPIRYTALSSFLGAISILLFTYIATSIGYVETPALGTVGSVWMEMAYLIVIAGVIAVLSWNSGIKILGPLNGVLFINLVPITAFAIGIAQGHRFVDAELIGATITVSALIANNISARIQAARLATAAA